MAVSGFLDVLPCPSHTTTMPGLFVQESWESHSTERDALTTLAQDSWRWCWFIEHWSRNSMEKCTKQTWLAEDNGNGCASVSCLPTMTVNIFSCSGDVLNAPNTVGIWLQTSVHGCSNTSKAHHQRFDSVARLSEKWVYRSLRLIESGII